MFLILSPQTHSHSHSLSFSLSQTLPLILCPLSHSPSLLWTNWFLGHGAMICWSNLGGQVVGCGSDGVVGPMGSWVDGYGSDGLILVL